MPKAFRVSHQIQDTRLKIQIVRFVFFFPLSSPDRRREKATMLHPVSGSSRLKNAGAVGDMEQLFTAAAIVRFYCEQHG
jgi:hypothetical protein